jgi:hypothetical protein
MRVFFRQNESIVQLTICNFDKDSMIFSFASKDVVEKQLGVELYTPNRRATLSYCFSGANLLNFLEAVKRVFYLPQNSEIEVAGPITTNTHRKIKLFDSSRFNEFIHHMTAPASHVDDHLYISVNWWVFWRSANRCTCIFPA